jgi:hypothetical protein
MRQILQNLKTGTIHHAEVMCVPGNLCARIPDGAPDLVDLVYDLV